jgi:hypothetical protein
MKGRDRLILMGMVVVVVLGGVWMLVVSPERQKAGTLNEAVASAKTQLSTAEGELSKARAAKAQYGTAYASVVSLGKAVPAGAETPSLVYEIADAAEHKNVFFGSISSGSSGGSSSATAAASAATAGFSTMPFSFTFGGSFFNLEHLLHKITNFATLSPTGSVNVNGRLLSIQSVALTATAASGTPGTKATMAAPELTGTVSASAYVLPAGQSVTGEASPASPAGAAAPAASTTSSSTTAPATVTVTP